MDLTEYLKPIKNLKYCLILVVRNIWSDFPPRIINMFIRDIRNTLGRITFVRVIFITSMVKFNNLAQYNTRSHAIEPRY